MLFTANAANGLRVSKFINHCSGSGYERMGEVASTPISGLFSSTIEKQGDRPMNTNHSFKLNLSKHSKIEFITTPIFYANGEPLVDAYTNLSLICTCPYKRLTDMISAANSSQALIIVQIDAAAQSNNLPATSSTKTVQSFQCYGQSLL